VARIVAWRYYRDEEMRVNCQSAVRDENPVVFARRRMGGSVSWTFSDCRSIIRADVIQQGLQGTREHARGSEVAASKSEDAGREDNFQYKRYADVLRDVQLSGTLFGMLSPRISNWSVTHWKWIRLNKFRGRRRGSHRETP